MSGQGSTAVLLVLLVCEWSVLMCSNMIRTTAWRLQWVIYARGDGKVFIILELSIVNYIIMM